MEQRVWLPLAPQLRLAQQVEESERQRCCEYGGWTELDTRSTCSWSGVALTSA
jgi:hypothetical protein